NFLKIGNDQFNFKDANDEEITELINSIFAISDSVEFLDKLKKIRMKTLLGSTTLLLLSISWKCKIYWKILWKKLYQNRKCSYKHLFTDYSQRDYENLRRQKRPKHWKKHLQQQ